MSTRNKYGAFYLVGLDGAFLAYGTPEGAAAYIRRESSCEGLADLADNLRDLKPGHLDAFGEVWPVMVVGNDETGFCFEDHEDWEVAELGEVERHRAEWLTDPVCCAGCGSRAVQLHFWANPHTGEVDWEEACFSIEDQGLGAWCRENGCDVGLTNLSRWRAAQALAIFGALGQGV